MGGLEFDSDVLCTSSAHIFWQGLLLPHRLVRLSAEELMEVVWAAPPLACRGQGYFRRGEARLAFWALRRLAFIFSLLFLFFFLRA